jgi:hypothetical protein
MYSEIIEKIKEYDSIVIARHIGVDPDALCSQLALKESILSTYPNKKVLAIGTGSSRFTGIGKLDKIEKVTDALLIICDTPDKKRVDSLDFSQGKYTIKIDHHPFIEKFTPDSIEYIDEDAFENHGDGVVLLVNPKRIEDFRNSIPLYKKLFAPDSMDSCTENSDKGLRNNDNYGIHYGEYAGTYAQDVAGYSDDVINDAFDGEPDAYWNID